MYFRFRNKLNSIFEGFRCFTLGDIAVPLMVLISALFIRLSTGGTHCIYVALGGRGFFPGPFLYSLFYVLRLIMASFLLSHFLFERKCVRVKVNVCIVSVISVVLLLLEYRLIFGRISLLLAMAFTVVSGILLMTAAVMSGTYKRGISIAVILYTVFQLIFFVQLISLAICI